MKTAPTTRRAVLATLALGLSAGPAFAQGAGDWPKRQPIKIVAVFPPGGSVDQVARILAPALGQQLGQTVIVDNKGGASGSIGTAAVVQSPPDGYTLAVVFDTHGVNPALIPGLPYDTTRDLVPLVLVGTSPMVLATHVNSEFKTFADVVAAAKARKPVSYGSIGNGSLGHLAMSLLARNGNLEWTHVPYKGGGPLMQDAVAGHVPLSIGSVFVTKPHLDSKRMRALAVTSSRRSEVLPDVPTIAESGFPGFDAPAWWAVLAPARTPPEIVRRLNEELNKALKNPDIARKLDAQGIDVVGGTVDSARAFIDKQVATWSKVVKDNNIKAD
ncbi:MULTISPECIES: Bug family tripartite tricarboxylate transporter substrate binding protein [Ramlibacter]|jgi:tripartite-type tricarboxylate transporter receptor subunit TctC|uniref:Tripartite tricarboxylate transporter substrate binding protein n=1 Tax=Ramlibacter pinisoli TaxID=2682844 RepID=A0A6N8ITN4_9BURK|nr:MULTISPECIES: tripartite tricarboxylate transporter substrate binding protein [Ramlibacter]MBA2964575.1 tripartite tricarboxylate transporter substrate binding protein [Ramlibacter sp. CGMCC 1.13660]MVQ29540.1 tripartite tricarboxylate transporter substrate binding protein [Ramlibacter pinisoli]